MFIFVCPCHTCHLSAASVFLSTSPDIEVILRSYYYISINSSNLKSSDVTGLHYPGFGSFMCRPNLTQTCIKREQEWLETFTR